MRLVIGEKVIVKRNPKNAYVIECEVMFGDADGKEMVTLGPFKESTDMEYLYEAIQACKNMKNAYPNGMGGDDNHNHVEGYDLWFSGCLIEGLPKNDPRYKLSCEWPQDPTNDYEGSASFEEYKIYYYDENEIKYHVKEED